MNSNTAKCRAGIYWLSLLLAFSQVACRRNQGGSDLQSLHALKSGGAIQDNAACGPQVAATSPEHRHFASLPPRLQSEFSSRQSWFQFSSQASQICQNEILPRAAADYTAANSSSLYRSCWRPAAQQQQQVGFEAILSADPAAMNREFIPLSVLAYAELYIDNLLGPASDMATYRGAAMGLGERQLRVFVSDFRDARRALAKAFIDDMLSAGGQGLIQLYASRYASSSDMLFESINFQNYVMAELTHAYYCSPDTVRQFNAHELVRTRGAYLVFVDFFGAPWYAQKSTQIGQVR